MTEEQKNDYEDIIHLPHHVSPTRRQMTPEERAAQFAPFAALTGYGAAIEETGRLTSRRHGLYEDDRARMEETLRTLAVEQDRHPEAEAVYFVRDPFKDGGSFRTASGRVKRVDPVERVLVFEDGTEVPLADLVELTAGENRVE